MENIPRYRQFRSFGRIRHGISHVASPLPRRPLSLQNTQVHLLRTTNHRFTFGDRHVCRFDEKLLHWRSFDRLLLVPLPLVLAYSQ